MSSRRASLGLDVALTEEYFRKHGIMSLLHEMVDEVVEDQPLDPLLYMAEWTGQQAQHSRYLSSKRASVASQGINVIGAPHKM